MSLNQKIIFDHLPVFNTMPELSSGPLSVAELAWIGYTVADPESARDLAGPFQSYVFGLVKNYEFQTINKQKTTEDLLLTISFSDVVEFERQPRMIVPIRWQYDPKAIIQDSRYSDAVVSSYQVIRTYKPGELVMRAPTAGEFDPDSYWTT